MVITILLMALAVLFGLLVLLCLWVGRRYEMRHGIGELGEEHDGSDQIYDEYHKPAEPSSETNAKEKM